METTYPDITVTLTGTDGNASGAFTDAAFDCGSYDAVLRLCMQTVNVR